MLTRIRDDIEFGGREARGQWTDMFLASPVGICELDTTRTEAEVNLPGLDMISVVSQLDQTVRVGPA